MLGAKAPRTVARLLIAQRCLGLLVIVSRGARSETRGYISAMSHGLEQLLHYSS